MVRVDPPIDRWADALQRPGAVVATGHQAFLWHPGILAKLLAVQVAAERFRCRSLHVVVDQDPHDALTLDVPRVEDNRLHVDTITLGKQKPDVPTGFHPPSAEAASAAGLPSPIRDALAHAQGRTLAHQLTAALRTLIEPVTGPFDTLHVSAMWDDPRYRAFVSDMAADARRCAQAYNTALRETATRDVAALSITADAVELPLWACAWNQPRQRVYVRDGQLDTDLPLLPKALTLSAVMRTLYADLFIHGLGGEIYDRATEAWCRNWRGETLNPTAIVTADLRLDFGVPVATRDDLARAVWERHHMKHNGDPRKKQPLLQRMAVATDRTEKAVIFRDIHAIVPDPAALRQAEERIARARVGVANAVTAARRDWCVGLYPPPRLAQLRAAIASRAD